MKTGKPISRRTYSRRAGPLLLGTLVVLLVVGCSGSFTLTPASAPIDATPIPASGSQATTATDPSSAPQIIAGTRPKPTDNLGPTPLVSVPTLTATPGATSTPLERSDPRPTPTEEIAQPLPAPTEAKPAEPRLTGFPLPPGSRPHDVTPALDGGVWYTAQGSGELGWLDPETGETRHTRLGFGSRPHGVIVGPDGAPWITDSGLNAIVRVDPETLVVDVFPLPPDRPNANLNTATFDSDGVLWFTGQSGIYGRFDPVSREMNVFDAPRGRGPYGIAASPDGSVYYASLAGSYVGRIDTRSGEATVLDPPTQGQGARRVWADSQGRIWVSEWNARKVALYDPSDGTWREWKLPGSAPRAYAVYVDEKDLVWLSDFGGNSVVRFDSKTEAFEVFGLPSSPGNVRQILGRDGEVWLPESAADQLVRIRH
mgnify:CR=1 FL=1